MISHNDDEAADLDVFRKIVTRYREFVIQGVQIGISGVFEIGPGNGIYGRFLKTDLKPCCSRGLAARLFPLSSPLSHTSPVAAEGVFIATGRSARR